MSRPTVNRVLPILQMIALLALLLPAIAAAAPAARPVAAGLAEPCASAGPSVAEIGLEPTATAAAVDTWEPSLSSPPSSSATPNADPMNPIFSAYGGGRRVCLPGCSQNGVCCDHMPNCDCNPW